jgi:predicted alpha/beta hydrolase family esterase
MPRFVLVHGAWHGAWCWREVAGGLERRGHHVETPNLPCDEPGLTVERCASVVGSHPDAIVVGHSLGAQVVSLVDARVRVYVAGLLPTGPDRSMTYHPNFSGTVRDELGRSYWPDAETCAAHMYPDCNREQADAAFAQLRRQSPLQPVADTLCAHDVVVATTKDAAIEPEWQLRKARDAGARIIELATGHSPFVTHPGELTDVLDSLA